MYTSAHWCNSCFAVPAPDSSTASPGEPAHSGCVSFDVNVTHAGRCCRVVLNGRVGAGRVLSLLQVLEIDSAGWPGDAVLVDLRELEVELEPDDQLRVAEAASLRLRRMKKIALLARPGRLREQAGVRVFDDEGAALHWLNA